MALSTKHYLSADACTMAQWVRDGDVTPRALLDMAMQRARALQTRTGAISQWLDPVALDCLDALPPRATLAGVPFLVKDLGAALAGGRGLASCRHLAQHAPVDTQDSTLMARFKAGGLVPFGKTTVPEFGLNLSTEPAIGPVCRNPWNPARSAGGSSGGSAAAVAAGIVPMAHATDAAGSIRVPAAACGLVGLKPGRGTVPQGPQYNNLLGGLASELVLSRSVRDSAAAWDLVRVRGLQHSVGPRTLDTPALKRIALLDLPPQGVPQDGQWAGAAHAAARRLEGAGHRLSLLDSRRLEEACALSMQAFDVFGSRRAAAAVQALQPAAQDMECISWAAAHRGQSLSALDHVNAEIAVARCGALLDVLWEEFDLILSPALAQPIPLLGQLPTTGTGQDLAAWQAHLQRFTDLAPYSALANVSGCPAIVVPHGQARDGMPLAIQILAPPGGEDLLLAVAAFFETEAPWPQLAPMAYV